MISKKTISGILFLRLFPRLFLALLFGSVVFLSHFLKNAETAWVEPSIETIQIRRDPQLYQAVSLGHWPALVDWFWMKALQDSSMSRLPKGVHPAVYYDFDIATELDPAFFEIYYHGSALLAVVRDDVLGARDLLLKAERFRTNDLSAYPKEFREEYWSKPWLISLQLAYLYLFELEDMPNAARAFREAANISGAPPYLLRLEKRLETKEGQYDVLLKLLRFLMGATVDEKILSRFEKKIEAVQLGFFLFRLNQQFEEFRRKEKGSLGEFLKKSGLTGTDPVGGILSVDSSGKIISSSPRENVFMLE